MSNKDLGEAINNFEEEIEALQNKEFRLFGIKVTAVTISAALALASSGVGALYGAFVVYQDYMDMKEQIQSYVAPDLSGFQEQLSVMSQKMVGLEDSVLESRDYTRDIRIDLKSDIERMENSIDTMEDRVREIDSSVREALDDNISEVRTIVDSADDRFDNKRDALRDDTDRKLKDLEERLNQLVQRALDNPLSN